MTEQNNTPSAPGKSHLARNLILIFLIIGCIVGFVTLARYYGDEKDSKLADIISSIGSSAGMNIPMINALPSENYSIKQKTSMPFNVSVPYGFLDAKSNTEFIISGFPVTKAKAGSYGWQTDWKVIINSITQTSTKTQVAAGKMHSSALTGSFTPDSSQFVYYFTLKGVKKGDSFPMRYTIKNLSEATYHLNESNWIFYDEKNQPVWNARIDTSEHATAPSPEGVAETSAILIENNGNDGAIIAFVPAELTPDQKKELDRAKQVINQSWWNNQIYDVLMSPPQFPPMKIMLNDNFSDKGYIEEIIDNTKTSGSKSGDDEGGSEKIPDLAPLPSANDKNGDGIPDLVPLPGYQP